MKAQEVPARRQADSTKVGQIAYGGIHFVWPTSQPVDGDRSRYLDGNQGRVRHLSSNL